MILGGPDCNQRGPGAPAGNGAARPSAQEGRVRRAPDERRHPPGVRRRRSRDPAEALAAAGAVNVDRLSAGLHSRRAQVHLDLAWAQSQRKRDAEATLHLLEAERAAPESIRYNVMAREMLGRQRKKPTRTLTDLAARAGALE